MPKFLILDPRAQIQVDIDFATFINIVKGMTITSAASSDDMRYAELGLSENFNLRVESANDGDIIMALLSTLNVDDIPPLKIQIVPDDDKEATAEVIERRIWLIRQTYAIALLVNTGRAEQIGGLLERDKDADIEKLLLRDDERLYIRSAGPGSFWLTIFTKSKVGYKTAANLFAVLYDEGRELLLRRVRANTVLKELEVEERRFDIDKKKVAGIIEMIGKIDKIDDERIRVTLKDKFINSWRELDRDTALYLPAPSAGKADQSEPRSKKK